MVLQDIAEFSVKWLQILDENGKADEKLMPKLTEKQMLWLYEHMIFTRIFDEKAFKLQRQGRIGTYGQSLGQEAQVGTALALQEQDWVFPCFREHGIFLARGMPMVQYLQTWAGDEIGAHIPEGVNMFTMAVPVATQIPHAVGFAWAKKLRKENAVAVVYFGDGATSRGDFHEGMNFAGTFKVPCVFVCQNNQWAISVPFSRQTAAKTVAQKAIAYGFDGIRVDGNDVFAVYSAVKDAVDKARSGGGPTLVECLTYRIGDHTTSDDAKKYRTEKEVDEWRKKDPIIRLEKYLTEKKILTDALKQEIAAKYEREVEEAVKKFELIEPPEPEEMFTNVYGVMPPELERQMKEAKGNAKQ